MGFQRHLVVLLRQPDGNPLPFLYVHVDLERAFGDHFATCSTGGFRLRHGDRAAYGGVRRRDELA